MSLHHVYIPDDFKYFYGNTAVKKSLESVLARNPEDIPRAYFFHGAAGCGKNALAEILRAKLEIPELGYRYYDTATTRGIDTVREIRELLTYGGKMMFVMDECHQITPAALEGMLSALLDTPMHKYFVLCTSEPGKIKPSIKRRCHVAEVKPLNRTVMENFLIDVIASEGVETDERVINRIVKASDGSPGTALGILDSVIEMTDVNEAIEIVDSYDINSDTAIDFCRAVNNQRWHDCQVFLKRTKLDHMVLKNAVMGYLRKVLVETSDFQKCEVTAKQMTMFIDLQPQNGMPGIAMASFLACTVGSAVDDIPF